MKSSERNMDPVFKGLIVFIMLGIIALGDFFTGFEYTFFLFYLAPVLFVQRWAGQLAALGMSLLCALIWLLVNRAEGQHYPDWTTLIWETGVRLSVYLMIVVLLSNRMELQRLVQQRTEKLRQEIEERNRLEKELLQIAEAEQSRIGQDLHDSLGQHLTATALAGKVLTKKLSERSIPEANDAGRLVALLEESIEITRKLARSLHPIEMRSDGLPDALQNLAANISRAFSVDCHFLRSGGELNVDTKVSGQLFRIAQEAVSNAIRHGRANQIILQLDGSGDRILLSITDNGQGLAADARSKNGLGLRIMDYRARMIGAKFEIVNLPAGGARAVCLLNPGRFDTEFYVAKK